MYPDCGAEFYILLLAVKHKFANKLNPYTCFMSIFIKNQIVC